MDVHRGDEIGRDEKEIAEVQPAETRVGAMMPEDASERRAHTGVAVVADRIEQWSESSTVATMTGKDMDRSATVKHKSGGELNIKPLRARTCGLVGEPISVRKYCDLLLRGTAKRKIHRKITQDTGCVHLTLTMTAACGCVDASEYSCRRKYATTL